LIIVRVYIQHKGRKPDQEPENNGANVWKNQGDIRDIISMQGVPVQDYKNILLRDKEQIDLDVEK